MITNLVTENNRNLFLHSFGGQGSKIKMLAGHAPFRGSGGDSSFPPPASGGSRDWRESLACDSVYTVSASILRALSPHGCVMSPYLTHEDAGLWISGPSG